MNALIYLAAAVLCATFAVRTLSGDGQDQTRRAFAVVGAMASLTFGGFTLYLLTGLSGFRYLHATAGTLLPAAILWFLDLLLNGGLQGLAPKPGPLVRRMGVASLVAVVAFLGLDLAFFETAGRASPLELVLALYVQVGFLVCWWRLWQAHERAEQRVDRARIRYLLGLLAAAAVFTAFEQILRWVDQSDAFAGGDVLARSVMLQGAIPPVGVVLGTLFIYFLHQVVQLYRLLDLHEIFARLFTLAVAALLLVAVDTLTVLQADALSEYPVHGAFQVFLASALFLSVYDPFRKRIETKAGEWFNRPGRRLELTLFEVDRGLARVISMEALGNELLGRLYASGRAPLVSLYLWDHERGAFRLALHRGLLGRPLMETIASHPFTEGFRAGESAYVRSDLQRVVRRRRPGHEDAAVRLRAMDAMEADVSLCIRSGDLVLGWLNLASEPWTDGFSQDEIRRLAMTVDRAAVLIENIYSFEQLKEQHRLAALGTMAAGLAHEIRNPLAGIKGAAQYLQDAAEEADPAEVADFCGIITSEVDRLGSVVTQFLDYARPLAIRSEPIDLLRLCERTVELVRRQDLPPGVRLVIEVAADLPGLRADADKLHQVLLNLVQNAVQAVGEQGRVRIEVGPGRIRRRGGQESEAAVELRVVDDGPGISAEDQEKLFIPFFTTRHDGTGLGLAISRRLVEAQGGELLARSQPGEGATFVVRLPVEPAAMARLPAEERSLEIRQS